MATDTCGVGSDSTWRAPVWTNPEMPIAEAVTATILGFLGFPPNSGHQLIHNRLISEPFELAPI